MAHFIFFGCLSLQFTVLIGAAKGICDTLQFHYSNSRYAKFNPMWWNPAISWKNKYKNYDGGDTSPKFLFATTLFVTFTDAWHTFQFIQNFAICFAALFFGLALLYSPFAISILFCVGAIASLRIVLQMGFVIFFR